MSSQNGLYENCESLTYVADLLVVQSAWDEKDVILKNEPEKLLKTKNRHPKTNRNKPENKAEKLLKTRACGKNEPERTGKQSYRSY